MLRVRNRMHNKRLMSHNSLSECSVAQANKVVDLRAGLRLQDSESSSDHAMRRVRRALQTTSDSVSSVDRTRTAHLNRT